ncbi:hypothetical protein RKE38_16150 [Phycicoccus sp. M110.8]|uniref:hypothetical protein n=1 Tax=Phycicoccus sp. M110.8 TaxID=3075433 RepID=UPI0028FD4187|nr:hypothetical protein [Phycicoccus sp. M110.8]MDU0315232.1 hypothetical protein [Phycicoccus sp. M110.8]
MGLVTHLTWGDSWRRPKEGLGRVVDGIQRKSGELPKPVDADDPSVDIYIYVSGALGSTRTTERPDLSWSGRSADRPVSCKEAASRAAVNGPGPPERWYVTDL